MREKIRQLEDQFGIFQTGISLGCQCNIQIIGENRGASYQRNNSRIFPSTEGWAPSTKDKNRSHKGTSWWHFKALGILRKFTRFNRQEEKWSYTKKSCTLWIFLKQYILKARWQWNKAFKIWRKIIPNPEFYIPNQNIHQMWVQHWHF